MESRLVSSPSPGPSPDAAELRQAARQARARFQPSPPRETQIRLVEVDPMQVHVSWHICHEDLRQAHGAAGQDAPLVLRLHDVAYMDFSEANPHATREVPLAGNAGSQYFTLAGQTRTVLAEIGLRGDGRELALLARSGVLRLPPTGQITGWAEDREPPTPQIQPLPGGLTADGKVSRLLKAPVHQPNLQMPVEPSMAPARIPFADPFDKLRASFPLVARPGINLPELPAWPALAIHFPALAALLIRDARWRAPRTMAAHAPVSSFALGLSAACDDT